ncbi:MAG: hypothetical protein J7518_14420 [Nocardioidaceae bacterium]|nr:hypothetical protein [Nocardioidaceae bacterium]
MRRFLVVLLLAAGMVLVSPSVALACSCVASTPAQAAKRADTVVVATLEWRQDNGIDASYGIRVDQVFKGIAGMREKVHSSASEASCGLGELATDEVYVFFLQGKHPGRLSANQCSGTAPYGEQVVTAVEKATGDPVEPLPTFSGEAEPSSDGPDRIRFVGIGVIVLALLGGGALVLRRRFFGPPSGPSQYGGY